MYSKYTFDHEIKLIAITSTTQDALANDIKVETETTVFAEIVGVYRQDFYNALQKGLKPNFVAKIHDFEYTGQTHVKYADKRFKIERAYPDGNGIVELTCAEVVP